MQRLGRQWILLCAAALLAGAAGLAHAAQPDPQGQPDAFVQAVAEDVLNTLKADPALQSGNVNRINQVVDAQVLPHVDFEKTTRLAVGRYWREATPEQRQALVDGFRGTLIRTYSGAFSKVDNSARINMLPFRGDASADDVVVRSQVMQSGTQPAAVDYRLERTPQGWRIYDVSVEGIWLIQNYRNQFASQIQQGGIDGLIATLQQRNLAQK
ncbi:ABC transporter substrate-binding protein [Verticiella sediminum]|uniref:ABC transporter substrate-binding protein n=1 Tax=Verticiella sediminum TaxID=1247510 RepID=A0A556A8G8_9BURK|nr:ABC transporter substrate-binding protein [Verticiella sediminum]TSH89173.1 ABC transporter substrate-binding protein [Verticiella sediminum]